MTDNPEEKNSSKDEINSLKEELNELKKKKEIEALKAEVDSINSQSSDPTWDEIKNKKLTAGLLGLFFGAFGAHKFVLGYTKEGLIYLGVSIIGGIITCGGALAVSSIVALIESIMLLTKTPEEFKRTYIDNKKGWF